MRRCSDLVLSMLTMGSQVLHKLLNYLRSILVVDGADTSTA